MQGGHRIRVNAVFSPGWWNRHYGISFDQSFYFDLEKRIENDLLMRRALRERFGMGEPDPQLRPVIGPAHISSGFVVPALLGAPIRFAKDEAARPEMMRLDRRATMALRAPDLVNTWPMNEIIHQMNELEQRYGSVVGDLNTGGPLDTALALRGVGFLLDLQDDPVLRCHLLGVVAATQLRVAECIRSRTGTCAISVSPAVLDCDPALFLLSNCATQMITPQLYERVILPFDLRLASTFRPFGVHHCGNNLQRFTKAYTPLGATFFDVGWGSDVAECSRSFPNAFLNLRLSPVRMLQGSSGVVYQDVLALLRASGRHRHVGICAVDLDAETPDANVHAMIAAVRDHEAETTRKAAGRSACLSA